MMQPTRAVVRLYAWMLPVLLALSAFPLSSTRVPFASAQGPESDELLTAVSLDVSPRSAHTMVRLTTFGTRRAADAT